MYTSYRATKESFTRLLDGGNVEFVNVFIVEVSNVSKGPSESIVQVVWTSTHESVVLKSLLSEVVSW